MLAASDREHAHDDREDAAADRYSASLDELTGAYLRRPGLLQLERDLSRVSRDGGELVVAFVDVDQLKAVNDQGGHAAGDRLLQHTVQSLQARLRPHDLIIRFGGDEFVCVVAGLALDDVAARLRQANDALTQGPAPGSFTVGLARLHVGDTAHELIERADRALYQQRAGRQFPQ
jgi:diguanylate cyclase (GGDEF)-like protein